MYTRHLARRRDSTLLQILRHRPQIIRPCEFSSGPMEKRLGLPKFPGPASFARARCTLQLTGGYDFAAVNRLSRETPRANPFIKDSAQLWHSKDQYVLLDFSDHSKTSSFERSPCGHGQPWRAAKGAYQCRQWVGRSLGELTTYAKL